MYGVREIWTQLNREGITVAKCTVRRLMRQMGLRGATRGRVFKTTTTGDDRQTRPADLVCCDFTATAPNQLRVSDLTYVAAWSSSVYVAFVIDAFSRRIVGWRASRWLRTDLGLDALCPSVVLARSTLHNRTRADRTAPRLASSRLV